MEKQARGLRNNNPGNIRRSKDEWKGLRAEQTDKDFFQFEEMKWGYRALIRILQNYRKKYGCMTVAEMITKWAPANENSTTAYIRKVCSDMQVPSVYTPDVNDRTTMCAMAAAISRVENGVAAVMEDVRKGWEELG
jgi:hypothetical protein